jgi:hypothetical protein
MLPYAGVTEPTVITDIQPEYAWIFLDNQPLFGKLPSRGIDVAMNVDPIPLPAVPETAWIPRTNQPVFEDWMAVDYGLQWVVNVDEDGDLLIGPPPSA